MPSNKKDFSVKISGLPGKTWQSCGPSGSGGALYGLGFLGALFYYLSKTTDRWSGIVGVFKAIFWPAFLVHGLLRFLGQ